MTFQGRTPRGVNRFKHIRMRRMDPLGVGVEPPRDYPGQEDVSPTDISFFLGTDNLFWGMLPDGSVIALGGSTGDHSHEGEYAPPHTHPFAPLVHEHDYSFPHEHPYSPDDHTHPSGPHVHHINQLDGVDVLSEPPLLGQYLQFNGLDWVPGNTTHEHTIDSLTDVDTTTSPPGTNQILTWNGTNWVPQSNAALIYGLTLQFDGGGVALEAGFKRDVVIPFASTITSWTLLSHVSGSIVIDIWKDTYANYPPTVADSITAAAKPTLSAAQKNTSSTLTGWSPIVSAGQVLTFNVSSVADIIACSLALTLVRH